jgi:uncharacterized BrkB/YihY/UPF0761 family membrane protein
VNDEMRTRPRESTLRRFLVLWIVLVVVWCTAGIVSVVVGETKVTTAIGLIGLCMTWAAVTAMLWWDRRDG